MFVDARKLGALSSRPELEPGLLLGRDGVLPEPSDWWLDPGREGGFFLADSGS